LDKEKLLQDVINIQKTNKSCAIPLLKKKLLKKKFEPVDFVDIFLKKFDTEKEVNHKEFRKHIRYLVPENDPWISWLKVFIENSVYSNRYRKNFSKIFEYPEKLVDEKEYHKLLQQILNKCNTHLKDCYINNKKSAVKDYLDSRNFPFELIDAMNFGTNEFLTKEDCGILHRNPFLNVKHVNEFEYYGVTFSGIDTGGVRIINPETAKTFKYFFFAVRDDLYGIVGKSDCAVIAEGVFDIVGMYTKGYDTGFSFGSCAPSFVQLAKLKKILEQNKIKKIVLSVDNDVGGVCLAQDILNYFPGYEFKLITFNEVSEDPYECFVEKKSSKYELKDFDEKDLEFRAKLVLDYKKKNQM
jgi:hypothetical protein